MGESLYITDEQLAHFERNGFFLIPNPLGAEGMRQIDFRQQEVEPEWERTEFPEGCNRLACQFLMIGEPLLQMVEHPELVKAARRILDAEEVHVGACGIGDASRIVSADGRLQRQVHWHVDGGPEVKQVSFRTALDRHDASNAPLRVLPGSQHRSREEVEAELMQFELATGTHDEVPTHCFARHPSEVEVVLDPRWTLVWDAFVLARHWGEDGRRTATRHGLELLPAGRSQARRGGAEASTSRLAGLARGAAASLGFGRLTQER